MARPLDCCYKKPAQQQPKPVHAKKAPLPWQDAPPEDAARPASGAPGQTPALGPLVAAAQEGAGAPKPGKRWIDKAGKKRKFY